uniref:Uncharacterized protein n=1 Tax=Sphaerodactylus townsendi TaxID=933632 RepID=A0ACB8FPK4_9SAUR
MRSTAFSPFSYPSGMENGKLLNKPHLIPFGDVKFKIQSKNSQLNKSYINTKESFHYLFSYYHLPLLSSQRMMGSPISLLFRKGNFIFSEKFTPAVIVPKE